MEVTKIGSWFKILLITLCVFLTFSLCFCSENSVLAQTDQTALKLQAANTAIGQAFNSVLEAEKAGGNVTQLLSKLNTAGEILAEAQNALNSGTIANVTSETENAIQIADQVNFDAVNLRNDSLVKSQENFWFILIFSVVGAVVFSVLLLFVWRRFKRFYTKKLLGMKPEVIENTP